MPGEEKNKSEKIRLVSSSPSSSNNSLIFGLEKGFPEMKNRRVVQFCTAFEVRVCTKQGMG